ncbi:hypothetical protein [Algibacter mikhailovii]|uniref:Uncharacterized protein n=1 Tax=Algibacter mikhailovii TaxID=425498 RepID=A0A918QZ17_9FLAO|nr:hypothetical protein [Algibacter mikhailovii]GGZ77412.1 hypothetical protein GCM10007028_13350 [Algibacter mikhailovii]
MGGEGAMAAANNSLKNNRSLLSKRKDRKALSGSYEHVEIKDFPKATPEKLMEIKERLTRENKQARITYLIGFIVIILILTGGLYAIT